MKTPRSALLSPFLVAGLAVALSTTPAHAKDISVPFEAYEAWDEVVVDDFRDLLVQDGGRVKPIDTYARFSLLRFSGVTSLRFETGDGTSHKIDASSWMMDVLFRNEVAKDLPTFIVDDSAAVIALGVQPKERRDRYSYNDLLPGRAKLAELAQRYNEKQQAYEASEKRDKTKELSRVEGMILALGQNISAYEYLVGQFSFAQGRNLATGDVLPDDLLALAEKIDPLEVIDRLPVTTPQALMQSMQSQPQNDDEALLQKTLQLLFFYTSAGRGLALFPPDDPETEQWLSVGDLLIEALGDEEKRVSVRASLEPIKAMTEAARAGDEGEFDLQLVKLKERINGFAEKRDEGQRAALEVQLYEGRYFSMSLYLFVLGFVVTAISWLAPGTRFSRIVGWVAVSITIVALFYLCYGITLRCIIRQRPPITNLYETIIFITASAVLTGLFIEFVTRRGIAQASAVLFGVFGMFLSLRYEAKEAVDTMPQLVAVLDTNFWLATHVTIINIGYAAGLLAALMSHFWFILRPVLWGLRNKAGMEVDDRETLRFVTRMTYGIICFCLFFSLVGTVLGGIWANYSWGRFWGWDPKENGALMICLWSLVILHARMGGFFRDLGIHVASILLGVIVTFSWWGVNNLGVGLHSYGFVEGVWRALFIFWAIELVVVLLGCTAHWFLDKPGGSAGGGGKTSPREKRKGGAVTGGDLALDS